MNKQLAGVTTEMSCEGQVHFTVSVEATQGRGRNPSNYLAAAALPDLKSTADCYTSSSISYTCVNCTTECI